MASKDLLYQNTTISTPSTKVLNRGCLIPVPLDYNQILGDDAMKTRLVINRRYILQGEECDDFKMPKRIYICKAIIKDIGGVCIDAVVMKQVSDVNDTIFSLTKVDCKHLGITFEDKLQLFPISLNWKLETNETEVVFDESNMATYKPSPIDGTIHQMHVIMRGVYHQPNHEKILTPIGTRISINQFFSTLRFSFRGNIDGLKRIPLVVKPIYSPLTNNVLVDNDGLHLMVFFSTKNVEGINPILFEGKNIDDIFKVTWVEQSKSRSWILNDLEIDRRLRTLDKFIHTL